MLRVRPNISLDYYLKEERFNGDFWKGLVIALSIHIFLFCSLRLTLPPNLDLVLPLDPIQVEIDAASPTSFPHIYEELSYSTRHIPELPLTQPSLQQMEQSYSSLIPYEPIASLMEEERYSR